MKAATKFVYNHINREIGNILDGHPAEDDYAPEDVLPPGGAAAGGGAYGGGGTWAYHIEEYDWLLGNLLTTNVAADPAYQARNQNLTQ